VLALGKSLEIPVLAEGIETEGQLSLLNSEGCDEAKGYLLGRPVPLAQIVEEGHRLRDTNEPLLKASSSLLLAPSTAVKFKPVVDDIVAEFAGNFLLQLFDALGVKLDDITGFDVDQVIVVLANGGLEP
jgi:hypothetical protein